MTVDCQNFAQQMSKLLFLYLHNNIVRNQTSNVCQCFVCFVPRKVPDAIAKLAASERGSARGGTLRYSETPHPTTPPTTPTVTSSLAV